MTKPSPARLTPLLFPLREEVMYPRRRRISKFFATSLAKKAEIVFDNILSVCAFHLQYAVFPRVDCVWHANILKFLIARPEIYIVEEKHFFSSFANFYLLILYVCGIRSGGAFCNPFTYCCIAHTRTPLDIQYSSSIPGIRYTARWKGESNPRQNNPQLSLVHVCYRCVPCTWLEERGRLLLYL